MISMKMTDIKNRCYYYINIIIIVIVILAYYVITLTQDVFTIFHFFCLHFYSYRFCDSVLEDCSSLAVLVFLSDLYPSVLPHLHTLRRTKRLLAASEIPKLTALLLQSSTLGSSPVTATTATTTTTTPKKGKGTQKQTTITTATTAATTPEEREISGFLFWRSLLCLRYIPTDFQSVSEQLKVVMAGLANKTECTATGTRGRIDYSIYIYICF